MGFSEKIKFKCFDGKLDPLTGNVKFYNSTYASILDAIKLEKNLIRDKYESDKPIVLSLRKFTT
jgi:hypothetical protein